MINKISLISSIILVIISLLAIGSYIILSVNAVIDWNKYLAAAILSVFFVITGIRGIKQYKHTK